MQCKENYTGNKFLSWHETLTTFNYHQNPINSVFRGFWSIEMGAETVVKHGHYQRLDKQI